jgi:hypothetical protein
MHWRELTDSALRTRAAVWQAMARNDRQAARSARLASMKKKPAAMWLRA